MYCFFNKFFFKVEIFGNLPIFCHSHLVAIQDFVDREILFDRCGKCPMLCLFFDFKWTISAVKSTAHVMPCFMRQHSAFLCGGLAFAAINDKEIVKERDCEIVFEFNIHNVYVQSFQIIIHTANGCVHALHTWFLFFVPLGLCAHSDHKIVNIIGGKIILYIPIKGNQFILDSLILILRVRLFFF